ncbi:sensor histidine kinase [Magnetospirillum sulfuroxidans]|uniref:histidine kinase n=1 Tax=Magnetospirillum sulfuroxidans TaxID=611300 RepID=A0ABS5IFJ2_9PROT|nr:ATP-binding protein [Magnetospirillum sulfuroxidans]MBR9973190.1 HAMP domain-containing histidine kinase [Magnetospirillum sulfuroxidans]
MSEGGPAGGFSLFDAEERILASAGHLLERMKDGDPSLLAEVQGLADAYSRSVREQRRLVKVSDRQQNQMAQLNQELGRRRMQAEEALGQLRQAQETLVQTEKLASLGALVGGVAHEINTPVGIALSCASHLADATLAIRALFDADDIGIDDFQRYMDTAADTAKLIVSNCERAADLIRSFKQVAVDRTSSERRRFRLLETLNETVTSLKPNLRQAGHKVAIACPADLVLDGYPGVLSQVLTNFVMNSLAHGFDAGQHGHLTITADVIADGQVRLSYDDDGKGIPEEYRNRIFDPFFTTRRGSGGSGLGLHIVFNLVTGPLGGQVSLDNGGGGGTRFVVTFPQVAPDKGI